MLYTRLKTPSGIAFSIGVIGAAALGAFVNSGLAQQNSQQSSTGSGGQQAADPFGGAPNQDPFGGTPNQDPFGGDPGGSSDPFGGDDPFGAGNGQNNPFGSRLGVAGIRPAAPKAPTATSPTAQGFSGLTITGPSGLATVRYGQNRLTQPQAKALQEQVAKLQSEDASSTEKEEAREKLSFYLGKLFDNDLKHRVEQVRQLEKQIEQLKEQVQKRMDAKDRLIELRIELMLNEADGLGFPEAWNQTRVVPVPGMATTFPYRFPSPVPPTAPPAATSPVPLGAPGSPELPQSSR